MLGTVAYLTKVRQSPPKHVRTTSLPTATSVANYFNDFTAKTPMESAVLVTI